jgi:uncharacterized delta-60 repeat protein
MKSTWPLIATLAIAIAACSTSNTDAPTTTVSTSQPKFVGLLEVQITGIGEGGTPTSSARFVDPASLKPGLKAKTVTVVPVNGTNAPGDVEFISRSVGFFDDDSTTQRYINSTFELVNRTATNFNNFTLYAVDVPGVTIGGTGIASLKTVAGTAITDVSVARSFKPTHDMRKSGLGVVVNADNADMQLFTPTEVNNPTDGVQQQATPSIIPVGSTVLEYGFVARNKGNLSSRSIAARNVSSDCTADTCKGLVTLAYKLPRLNPRASNPWSFVVYFVVADDTQKQVSQSLEEQGAGTVAGLSSLGTFDQVRTLVGSSYSFGADNLNPVCRVRTATGTTADSFLGVIPTPVAGGLDVCFGVGGKRTTAIGSGYDFANAVAIQSDGKIITAGYYSLNNSTYDFALARYNTNGSLDTSFDIDGKVTTAIGSSNDFANAVAIQSDGKIVAAGSSGNGSNSDFALARYNTNGSLDTSFDIGGILTTAIGSRNDFAYAVAIQSDGKIVAAGYYSLNLSDNDFALARYNP